MYIILGATGHVGSAVADVLLKQGQDVTVVTHDEVKGQPWARRGAKIAVADIRHPDALRAVFRAGKRAFLLNPPAAPDTDTDLVERGTVRNILDALEGSGLEQVVAQSTYGAQSGERLGDLSTLHDLEAGLQAQAIPFAIIRAAYYFSNWDALLTPVRESGALPTMFPADLKLPMVATEDLGLVAARLLRESAERNSVVYVEGPERYSANDVAKTFAKVLQREVEVAETPRDQWERAYRKIGFSEAAAHSYARMTAITSDGDYDMPQDPIQGTISLQEHVASVVRKVVS